MCRKPENNHKCYECGQCMSENPNIDSNWSLVEYLESIGNVGMFAKVTFGSRFLEAKAYLKEQSEKSL